jgi:hypothetical protein
MRALLLIATLASCSSAKEAPAPAVQPPPPLPVARPNFELDCAASNTSNAAQMMCVRTDTRTGDIQNVNYMGLPVTNGPTAVEAGPPGRFTTACAAPATAQRADFYCLRLNTQTGEMVLVNLLLVPQVPAYHPK